MLDPTPLNAVAEFHETFKHPILPTPQIPSKERCKLRVELISEELKELQEGIDNGSITDIADALCDLQYVLSGAILEFGLAEKFKELFNEVHRSNMSKACKSIEEAEQTIQFYKEYHNCESYFQQEGELFLVYRKGDHKVLKSVNYSPADLPGMLG
ncbi:MAG TPA: nucleoside triphosphate pyrophosphohydrolase family protein [Niabella sp.]|nr:nucleoside triphosphate pyrophosphohydrolase family protein [Niabella sp.]HQX21430.1 nucleoside triphosphate pyrophosphohydrolase family protein [Niabella sp.]HQX73463.1 nucleoside triphosphate pyrophosphohydrolase family protein [Chitinophagaceae bacterium]HRB36128.1 nucleoside triphosphate pyrophosphohydrolase family protein [Niabella sp.]HRB79609.1 nucleoside triphosphate pyrophosphohydrolase family protein [Niabella sp.]